MPQTIETIEAEIVDEPLMQEFQKLITYAKGKNPRLEYFSQTAQENALQTLLRIEHKKGNFTQLSTNDIIELLNHNTASSLQKRATTQEIPNATKNATQQKLDSKDLPTKSNLERDLTQQEIKESIAKWDLTKPNANDKLILSKVGQDELELLKKNFDFKGNYAVVREIDAEHLAHALNRHSDEMLETSRNQIPITKDEVLDYQNIIKTHDTIY